MLQALLITFREGIESFLIIGIVAAYLRKTERHRLLVGVRVGLAISVATCTLGAWLWLEVPNQPVYEGAAALTAAALVAALLWQTVRAGRRIKGAIERRLEGVAGTVGAAPSTRAILGVAAMTALLVTREGLEAVFFLGVQVLAARASADRLAALPVIAGAATGLALAGALAWSWTRVSRRLNLAVLLKVTALFLTLFLIQLVVYGVHELAESGVIQGSQAFHDATERFGPDGNVGHLLSYSLLAAPLVYLFWARRARLAGRSPDGPPLAGTAA